MGLFESKINDSKILTEKKRYNLRSLIEKCAIEFQVAHVFQDEIDKINYRIAISFVSIENAKENLKKKSSEQISKIAGGINLPFDMKFPS